MLYKGWFSRTDSKFINHLKPPVSSSNIFKITCKYFQEHSISPKMAATYTTPKRPLTWLITGSSSGFGLALARIVQANGHNLIATSRKPSATPHLVSEVESKGGQWIQLDVNDVNCDKVIDDLESRGQQVDVLVNNAGYCIYNPVETFTDGENRALMETLYFGPSRLIRAAVKHQRKRRFGIIVNMSSGAALEANPTMGPYGAGKAAMDST